MKKILIVAFMILILVVGLQFAYAKNDNANANGKEKQANKVKNVLNYTNFTDYSGKGQNKVEICHKGKNTLTIASPALKAHLKHKDVIGACSDTPRNHTDKPNNNTNTNKSRLYLNIVNPTEGNYSNSTLLLNITSRNASSIWYNFNGTNVTYTGPLYVTFNEGNNTLNVYANSTNGKNRTSTVKFFINSSIISNNTNQTNQTIVAGISNLSPSNVTNSTITWNWINPSINFLQAILFLNGQNLANTTNYTYTFANLTSNTNYTLDVQTLGNNSIMNATNVSSTVSTLN